MKTLLLIFLPILIYSHKLTNIDSLLFPEFHVTISLIKFSHDQSLYAILKNSGLYLYINTNKNLGFYQHIFEINNGAEYASDVEFYSDDSQMLVLLETKIEFYNLTTFIKKNEVVLKEKATHIALSYDDKLIAITYGFPINYAEIYNISSKEVIFSFNKIQILGQMEFSSKQNVLMIPFLDSVNKSIIVVYNLTQKFTAFCNFGMVRNASYVQSHLSYDGKYLYILTKTALMKYNLSKNCELISKYQKKQDNFIQFRSFSYDRYFILSSQINNATNNIRVLDYQFQEIQNMQFIYSLKAYPYQFVIGTSPKKGMLLIFNPSYFSYNTQFQIIKYSLCDLGQYYTITNDSCLPCKVDNCNVCSTDQKVCENCLINYYVNQVGACSKCNKGCKICSVNTCFWCSGDSMKIIGSQCFCIPPKIYQPSSNRCKQCYQLFPGCLNCNITNSGQSFCTECDSNKNRILLNNICVCSEGYYEHKQANICIKCSPNCKSCKDGKSCQVCLQQYQYKNNICVQISSLRLYIILVSIGSFLLCVVVILLVLICRLRMKKKKQVDEVMSTMLDSENKL